MCLHVITEKYPVKQKKVVYGYQVVRVCFWYTDSYSSVYQKCIKKMNKKIKKQIKRPNKINCIGSNFYKDNIHHKNYLTGFHFFKTKRAAKDRINQLIDNDLHKEIYIIVRVKGEEVHTKGKEDGYVVYVSNYITILDKI